MTIYIYSNCAQKEYGSWVWHFCQILKALFGPKVKNKENEDMTGPFCLQVDALEL